MAVYVPVVPVPVPVVPSGVEWDVNGTEAVIIGACILLPSIWLGVLIYDLYRRYRDLYKEDREAKKNKKRRKKE